VFSGPSGTCGWSQCTSTSPGVVLTFSLSDRDTFWKIVSSEWYPPSNRPRIRSVRFIFAKTSSSRVLLVDRDAPDFFADASVDVSLGLIVPLVVAISTIAVALAWLVARSHRRRGTTGVEGLLGEPAEALTEVGPGGGRVRLHGERWNATSKQPLQPGERSRVIGVHGLTLEVSPTNREGEGP